MMVNLQYRSTQTNDYLFIFIKLFYYIGTLLDRYFILISFKRRLDNQCAQKYNTYVIFTFKEDTLITLLKDWLSYCFLL